MNLSKIFQNKKNSKVFLLLVSIFTLLYFIFKNLWSALNIIRVPLFTIGEKFNLFLISLFDISELRSIVMLILVILFILSISLFFLFLFILFKESKKINHKKSFLNTLSIFISILGLSCASCGLGFLASVLSFFGVSSLITFFPLHGLELGFLGIIFLNISNYFLLKRINKPLIC